jgi:UDP-GlcNAc:undecaprenyl-phosphate/decaprenyl-phosphate GlcNAc-1-phosphate transferase
MALAGPALPGLVLFAALALTLIVCVNARPIGQWASVIDHPDEGRKRHAVATPLVGGIAIVLPLAVWAAAALLMHIAPDRPLLFAVLLCGAGMGLIGFADDQSSTAPLSRTLSLLVFLAIAFVVDPSLISHSLNWGSFDATPIGAWPYYLLMAVTSVGIVNAVNMADGQNGVVTSMFVIWAGCLALIGGDTVSAIAIVILVAAAAVFCFNLMGRLFLGDCGTYGVTFALGLLVAAVHAQGRVSLETIVVWFFIPVMDCLRLLISRPLRGRSPFEADRDHLHHRLQDKLGIHLGLATYAGAVALSSLTATLAPRFALVCLTVLTAFYFSFAWLTDPQSAAETQARDAPPKHKDLGNVVALGEADRKRRDTN